VCALFVCAAVWLSWPESPQQKQVAEVVQKQQVQQPDDAFFDAAADYMMLDNQDIYTYLAEN